LASDGKVTIPEKKLYCPGCIIQVVSSTKTDVASTASTSWADTGLQVLITPTTASNKIFLTCNLGAGISNTGYSVHFKLDGTTSTAVGDAGSSAQQDTIGGMLHNTYQTSSMGFSFLDSPGSTSEKTYKLQFKSTSGSVTVFLNAGNNQDGNTANVISTLTAMEVAA